MKLTNYLQDKLPQLVMAAATFALLFLFLSAFHVSTALKICILTIFLLYVLLSVLTEFFHKRKFYNRLIDNLSRLDKKYLASEIVPEPDFYEGQLLHDVMYEMGKAMTEQNSLLQLHVNGFKEYVELWVHEAKLPISSMLLKLHSVQTSLPHSRDEISNAVPVLRRELHRLDSYTDRILYYTRSEVAEKDFLIAPCQLSRIFGNAAAKMREDLLLDGFEIQTEGLDKTVLTDGKWLEFILTQLISNSLKYQRAASETGETFAPAGDAATDSDTKEKSSGKLLKLTATAESGRTRLSVWDNGIGIPSADLPRIFEKSFTGTNGRLRARSTGMGLFIVKQLCDKLGHRITVSSVENEYTEFTITFGNNDFFQP